MSCKVQRASNAVWSNAADMLDLKSVETLKIYPFCILGPQLRSDGGTHHALSLDVPSVVGLHEERKTAYQTSWGRFQLRLLSSRVVAAVEVEVIGSKTCVKGEQSTQHGKQFSDTPKVPSATSQP